MKIRKLIANPFTITAIIIAISITTNSWIPVYIVLGILAFATCIAIYVGTRKYKGDVNIFIVQNKDDDQLLSEQRFREMKQKDEILN